MIIRASFPTNHSLSYLNEYNTNNENILFKQHISEGIVKNLSQTLNCFNSFGKNLDSEKKFDDREHEMINRELNTENVRCPEIQHKKAFIYMAQNILGTSIADDKFMNEYFTNIKGLVTDKEYDTEIPYTTETFIDALSNGFSKFSVIDHFYFRIIIIL